MSILTPDLSAELFGRRALISGGSGGIGYATADLLARCGAGVVIADIQEAPARSDKINFIRCDVRRGEDIDHLFHETRRVFDAPDILVCCAGRGIHERIAEGDPEKWRDVLELNIMGVLRLLRAFLPAMLERKQGDVVLVSSVAASHPYEWGGIYAASKAAVDMIAETLRLEVQPEIRVTTISPGVVNTDFFENMISGVHTAESIGWGALDPSDVAGAILYAISRPATVALNNITLRPPAQKM